MQSKTALEPRPIVALAAGFQPADVKFPMVSTNAVTKGDVVVIDETVFDYGNDTTDEKGWRWDTVRQPATANLHNGIFGVALEDIAAGAVGEIGFSGFFEVLVDRTTGAVDHGDACVAVNAVDYLDPLSTDTSGSAVIHPKVIAKPVEEHTADASQALTWCYFDGIHGFSQLTHSA